MSKHDEAVRRHDLLHERSRIRKHRRWNTTRTGLNAIGFIMGPGCIFGGIMALIDIQGNKFVQVPLGLFMVIVGVGVLLESSGYAIRFRRRGKRYGRQMDANEQRLQELCARTGRDFDSMKPLAVEQEQQQ